MHATTDSIFRSVIKQGKDWTFGVKRNRKGNEPYALHNARYGDFLFYRAIRGEEPNHVRVLVSGKGFNRAPSIGNEAVSDYFNKMFSDSFVTFERQA